jgi:hypothetical protein
MKAFDLIIICICGAIVKHFHKNKALDSINDKQN